MAKKGGNSQTVTQTSNIDPTMQWYRDQALAASGRAAGVGAPNGGAGGAPYQTPDLSRVPEHMRAGVAEFLQRQHAQANGGTGAPGAAPGGYQPPDLSGVPPHLRVRIAARHRQQYDQANPAATPLSAPTPWDPQYADQGLGVYGGATNLANLGFGALSGDQAALGNFMNPYQREVIDQMTAQFGDMRSRATMGAGDAATKAGAFGGSRHALVEGTELAELSKQEAEMKARLYHTGFESAQQRAFQGANLGMGAVPGMFQLGEQRQDMMNPELRRLALLRRGVEGMPYGSTSTQTTPINQNRFGELLGYGLLGASLFTGGAAAPAGSMFMRTSGMNV